MTESLEQLDQQYDTLKGIRSIVRTMKTLSAINALPYERAAHAIESYRDIVLLAFQGFLHARGTPLRPRERNSLPVIVAFGSDHGLCGNYNELVASLVASQPDAAGACVLCVGAQLADALAGADLQPQSVLLPPASADGLGRLAGDLVTRLDALDRDISLDELSVTLVFTRRAEHARQQPVSERLLPLDPAFVERLAKRPWTSRCLPRTSAPDAPLFAALVREYLFATVFSAAAEALVTENAARLTRMQQAARSVDDRLENVAMQQRTVRQEQITTELLDVVVASACAPTSRARRPVGPSRPD